MPSSPEGSGRYRSRSRSAERPRLASDNDRKDRDRHEDSRGRERSRRRRDRSRSGDRRRHRERSPSDAKDNRRGNDSSIADDSARPTSEELGSARVGGRADGDCDKKDEASYASIMVGAMAGRPTKRRGGNEDDGGAPSSGQREVWGKPDEEPSARGKSSGQKGDGEGEDDDEDDGGPPKEKADFGLSGALAADAVTGNMLNGVVLKFSEPADARPPPAKGKKWRFYVFKGEESVETLHLGKQSAYLIGREKAICDVYMRHPSLSKQHAVLQYRGRSFADPKLPHAPPTLQVLPYLMDLGSTNGTFLNGERIEAQRYYELREKDSVRFAESSREYILLSDTATNS